MQASARAGSSWPLSAGLLHWGVTTLQVVYSLSRMLETGSVLKFGVFQRWDLFCTLQPPDLQSCLFSPQGREVPYCASLCRSAVLSTVSVSRGAVS